MRPVELADSQADFWRQDSCLPSLFRQSVQQSICDRLHFRPFANADFLRDFKKRDWTDQNNISLSNKTRCFPR